MRMSHNTAMTLDRPTGILTNTSMAGNMICTLVLAVSVHRSATLQTCFSAFLKFVLWIPGLTVMFSRYIAAAPKQLRLKYALKKRSPYHKAVCQTFRSYLQL